MLKFEFLLKEVSTLIIDITQITLHLEKIIYKKLKKYALIFNDLLKYHIYIFKIFIVIFIYGDTPLGSYIIFLNSLHSKFQT